MNDSNSLKVERKDVKVSIQTNGHKSLPAKGYINIQGYDRLSDYLDKNSSEWIKLYQHSNNNKVSINENNEICVVSVDSDEFKCYYKSNIVYITEFD